MKIQVQHVHIMREHIFAIGGIRSPISGSPSLWPWNYSVWSGYIHLEPVDNEEGCTRLLTQMPCKAYVYPPGLYTPERLWFDSYSVAL